MKKFTLSEEAREEIRKACKRLDEEKDQNIDEEDYFDKIDRMDFGKLAEEFVRLAKESGYEIDFNSIPEFDRAATPEEIAEEERKKNSYFNY